MLFSSTPPAACQWFSALATALDPRSAPRFLRLLLGAVLATGRWTVTRWLRAAGLTDEFRPAYTTVAAAGKRTDFLAARLVHGVLKPLLGPAERLVFALDDTPTPRYGPQVQGAGVHHNPTPGPVGAAFVYGHCWVVLAWLARHPDWGTLALPLLARLYVRDKDLPRVPKAQRPAFRTKLELAVELVHWAVTWLGFLGKPMWVVADGAYAKAALLRPLRAAGVTVVSRLRKDAALCSVPGPKRRGQRGPQRVYGPQRMDLAKRAGQRRGWRTETFDLYGKATRKAYKTFLATWRPAGGVIRVVLVQERRGWVAFFATDPAASVADILVTVAQRFSLETAFRDSKQEVGAGQQQVRKLAAGVGCFHICLWAYTLTEAWAWGRSANDLVDRADCPWDPSSRRPSHADKRRSWRRELLGEEIRAVLPAGASEAEIAAAAKRLLKLVA
jgi:DDE superfamily endonuclease